MMWHHAPGMERFRMKAWQAGAFLRHPMPMVLCPLLMPYRTFQGLRRAFQATFHSKRSFTVTHIRQLCIVDFRAYEFCLKADQNAILIVFYFYPEFNLSFKIEIL
jgi:hypothetical protein